jgi:broad specificity phosphatase PhoE
VSHTPLRVYLVRHGEAAASWRESLDPGLSELGRQQAEDAVVALRDQQALNGSPALISSPLRRARETAEPLSAHLRRECPVHEAFREIPTPVSLAQRQDWLRAFMRQRWSEQDESLLHWRSVMLEALNGIDGTTVVFTHFLVINTIVGALQGRDETLCFWPDHASITVLELRGGSWEVATLGREMATVVN